MVWLICGAAFVAWGCYTGDEGMYSLIGREVWQGRLMYRDLRCSQMPLMPYLYGGVMQFLPARIESGRVISLIFTFAGLVCAWLLVSKRYGTRAGFFGLLPLLLNRQLLFDGTQVRTQAISFFLATACLLCLSNFDLKLKALPEGAPPRSLRRMACIAALVAGIAVTARLSLLLLALALPLYVAFAARRFVSRDWRALAITTCACSLAPVLLVALYFARAASDRFFFNVYGFHRLLGTFVPQSSAERMRDFLIASFLATSVWSLIILFFAALLFGDGWKRKARLGAAQTENAISQSPFSKSPFELFVFILWMAITLLHGSQKMPSATHQIPMGWAACVLGAALAARFFADTNGAAFKLRHMAAMWLVILSISTWSWQSGALFFRPADHFRTPGGIYDLAAPLRNAPKSKVASFEAGLVFCAPQSVPLPGYELIEFSLMPRIGAERQEYFQGMSGRRLESDLLHEADFFVARKMDRSYLQEGEPGFDRKKLDAALRLYQKVWEKPGYGQFNIPIVLWRRKAAAE